MKSSDVFILGAGFSKAIERAMPALIDLVKLNPEGNLPSAFDKADPLNRMGQDYEAWLSRLAIAQPHRTVAENLRARQIYLEQVDRLVNLVSKSQEKAMRDPVAPWLQDLVALWDANLSTVITFNYDTLVEAAFDSMIATPARSDLAPLSNRLITWALPVIWPDVSGMLGNEDQSPTFKLLKLHGSLNWYWDPDAAQPSPLSRAQNSGRFGRPPEHLDRTTFGIDGRSPFIVPPLASKAALHSEPRFQSQWRLAADAIRAADRVFVLGFAFPSTDWGVTGFLLEALKSSQTRILVSTLSRDQRDIRQRLAHAGIHNVQFSDARGARPIPRLVATFNTETVTDLRSHLAAVCGTPQGRGLEVFVRGAEGVAALDAVDTRATRAAVEIHVGSFTGDVQLSGPNSSPNALTANALQNLLSESTNIEFRFADHKRRTFVKSVVVEADDDVRSLHRDHIELLVSAPLR